MEIVGLKDKNSLLTWPLSHLATKCANAQHLRVQGLEDTIDTNRHKLLQFVGDVCVYSQRLLTLHLENTNSSAEVGDSLMQALAKSSLSTLKNFTVVNEPAWFEDGRETCLVPLISFLERQYRLWKLDMDGCDLSDDQWNQI